MIDSLAITLRSRASELEVGFSVSALRACLPFESPAGIHMGGASSKTVRKLPRRLETPVWAGSRTTNPNTSKPPAPDMRSASEINDEGVSYLHDSHVLI